MVMSRLIVVLMLCLSFSIPVASQCEPDEVEMDQNWWGLYNCQQMQDYYKVCTTPDDPNHGPVMARCPATCANAREEPCPVPEEPTPFDCLDTKDWTDGYNGCDGYEWGSPNGPGTGWCKTWGHYNFHNGGANQNCCICGGGILRAEFERRQKAEYVARNPWTPGGCLDWQTAVISWHNHDDVETCGATCNAIRECNLFQVTSNWQGTGEAWCQPLRSCVYEFGHDWSWTMYERKGEYGVGVASVNQAVEQPEFSEFTLQMAAIYMYVMYNRVYFGLASILAVGLLSYFIFNMVKKCRHGSYTEIEESKEEI